MRSDTVTSSPVFQGTIPLSPIPFLFLLPPAPTSFFLAYTTEALETFSGRLPLYRSECFYAVVGCFSLPLTEGVFFSLRSAGTAHRPLPPGFRTLLRMS